LSNGTALAGTQVPGVAAPVNTTPVGQDGLPVPADANPATVTESKGKKKKK